MEQTCETDEMYLRLTDGDMNYSEYLECLPIHVEPCIKQPTEKPSKYSMCNKCYYTRRRVYDSELYKVTTCNERTDMTCNALQVKSINKSKYNIFNKKQKTYLIHIYKVVKTPKGHYTHITNELNQIGFPGQLITNKKIYVWFKNHRYRTRTV
jgi:hypothetical protein